MTAPRLRRTYLVSLALLAPGCGYPEEEAVAHAVVTSALQTNDSGGVGKDVVDSVDDTCIDNPELVA